jgi:uncharacterized protein YndB with AHSA1/START domain
MCNHSVAMASIERDIVLDAPADDVWRAISDESMLREWLAPDVELDARPGGALLCRTEDGEVRPGEVEQVEAGERLSFVWRRDGEQPSRVVLEIEVLERGTRLTVVETRLDAANAPQASAGWRHRLEALKTALAELAYA